MLNGILRPSSSPKVCPLSPHLWIQMPFPFFFPAYELNSCRGIMISFLHNDMKQKQNNSWRVSGISHLMILFFSGGALSLGGLMSDGSKLGFTWIQYRSAPCCLVMLEKPYMKLGYHIYNWAIIWLLPYPLHV